MTKNRINIALRPDTHELVMLFKIKTRAKDADEVIRKAIKLLKQSNEEIRLYT